MGFETCRALADERIRHSAELSPRLAQLLDAGMTVGADEYDAARGLAAQARDGLRPFFAGYDVILTPAAPGEAPAGLGYTGNPVFNRMWTLARHTLRGADRPLGRKRIADSGPTGRAHRRRCAS